MALPPRAAVASEREQERARDYERQSFFEGVDVCVLDRRHERTPLRVNPLQRFDCRTVLESCALRVRKALHSHGKHLEPRCPARGRVSS